MREFRFLGETIDDDDGHRIYRYELVTPGLVDYA